MINKIVGGAIPKEYIPAVDAGYPGRHAVRRAGRLQRGGRARSRCTTAPTTRSTPLKWPLRLPVPWPLRRPCAKADPVLTGAHHEGGCHRAGGVYGRRHRRPQLPPRHRSRAWRPVTGAQQINGACAALRDVRLRHRPALQNAGPRSVTAWSPATIPKCPSRSCEAIIGSRQKA